MKTSFAMINSKYLIIIHKYARYNNQDFKFDNIVVAI